MNLNYLDQLSFDEKFTSKACTLSILEEDLTDQPSYLQEILSLNSRDEEGRG